MPDRVPLSEGRVSAVSLYWQHNLCSFLGPLTLLKVESCQSSVISFFSPFFFHVRKFMVK